MTKELGYITNATFGFGGYQDAMIGLTVTLSFGGSYGGQTFVGGWSIKRPDTAQWSEADRAHDYVKVVEKVNELLTAAKKTDVSQLKGVPVEVDVEHMAVKSWRVLKEVIG